MEDCLGSLHLSGQNPTCNTPPTEENTPCLGNLNLTPSSCNIPTPSCEDPCVGDITPTPVICLDANYFIYDQLGELLGSGSIKSGQTKDIELDLTEYCTNCNPATYEVRDQNNNLLASGSINSGGFQLITINLPTCQNAVVNIRKQNNTLITSLSVPSGATQNYNVANSTITLKDTDGNTLSVTTVQATDNVDIVAPDVTYVITRDNLPFISGSEPSGGNIVVNVPSDCPPPPECDPLEITFGGYPLMTVPEPCGELVALSCSTQTIHAYVDDGSEVTGTYFYDDITGNYIRDEDHFIFYNGTAWEIEKTGGNIASANGSEEFPWQADWSAHPSVTVTQATIGQSCGGDVVCDDATAVLKDTAANVLSTTNIPSGTSQDITAPDSTLTVNSAAFTTARSGQTKDLGLINESNANITPISLTGGNIKVYTGGDTRLPKTGADTATISGDDATNQRGRGTSFFLLDTNNPFGHLRRFTGKTGGYHDGTNYKDVNGTNTTEALAFPDSVILDWMDETSTDVKAYRYTLLSGTANAVIAAQPYTHDTHADWQVCNINEVLNLARKKGVISAWFTWLPLNHTISATTSTFVMCTTPNELGNYFQFQEFVIQAASPAVTRSWYITRRYTKSSLGL